MRFDTLYHMRVAIDRSITNTEYCPTALTNQARLLTDMRRH